jgi:hypothetical protein
MESTFAGKYCIACCRYEGVACALRTVGSYMLICSIQDEDVDTLHLAAAIFLFDGRANESAFEMMQHEGAFTRLIVLIADRKDDASGLHRMLLELLFEMARIRKLSREDLGMSTDMKGCYKIEADASGQRLSETILSFTCFRSSRSLPTMLKTLTTTRPFAFWYVRRLPQHIGLHANYAIVGSE